MENNRKEKNNEETVIHSAKPFSRTTKVILLAATASIVLTLSIVFILTQPWNDLSVGYITTPVPVQSMDQRLTSEQRLRAARQREMDSDFLDSIEQFGVEGMTEIRLQQIKSSNNEN